MQSRHSVIASIGNIAIGKLSVFMFEIQILVIRNFSIGINNSLEKKAREGSHISKKLNKNGKTKSSTKAVRHLQLALTMKSTDIVHIHTPTHTSIHLHMY